METLCKEQARSLHQRVENQSGRFTVGPFAMSGLLQLFIIPCQGSRALSPLHPPRPVGCLCSEYHACVLMTTDPGMHMHVCVCVIACLFASVLQGYCQGGTLLIWASLQAMPRARKQETTGRVVCGPWWMCYILLVWHWKKTRGVWLQSHQVLSRRGQPFFFLFYAENLPTVMLLLLQKYI